MTLPARILNNYRVSLRSDSLILECQLLPDSPQTALLDRVHEGHVLSITWLVLVTNTQNHDSTAIMFLQLL